MTVKRCRYLLIGIALLLAAIALTGHIYPQSLTHQDAEALRIGDQKVLVKAQAMPSWSHDKLFIGSLVFNASGMMADSMSTVYNLNRGYVETNPLLRGFYNSSRYHFGELTAKTGAVSAAEIVGISWLSIYLHRLAERNSGRDAKVYRWMSILLPASQGAIHSALAVNNLTQ